MSRRSVGRLAALRAMSLPELATFLQSLAAGTAGVYAGTMLAEGFLLVPYWRSLPAAAFFEWYAANDRRLLGFFGPLTAAAAIVPLAAAVAAFVAGDDGRWMSVAAAAILVLTALMFPLFFQKPNESFASASVAPAELPAALGRWDAWHRVRMLLAVAALAFALGA